MQQRLSPVAGSPGSSVLSRWGLARAKVSTRFSVGPRHSLWLMNLSGDKSSTFHNLPRGHAKTGRLARGNSPPRRESEGW